MKEFSYKIEGQKKKQTIYAVCEFAAMLKLIYRGEKFISRSIEEVKHPVLA